MQPDRGPAEVEPGPDLAYIKRHGGQLEERSQKPLLDDIHPNLNW
jgi:hypothetical protein